MNYYIPKGMAGIIGLFCFMALFVSCSSEINRKPHVLLITGGHDFDTVEFFEIFESNEEIQLDTMSQPGANILIASGKAGAYDVLVFYDAWQEISEAEKQAYIDLSRQGKGFLFLHHSLGSYQDWKEFSKIRGGGYIKSNPPDSLKDMRYMHDLDLHVEIGDPAHPVTQGMKNFMIHDEGYSNIFTEDSILVLLKTRHPDCAEDIGWTHEYNSSRIVYLMGGHDRYAFENENYRILIRNSIRFLNPGDDLRKKNKSHD